MKPETIEAMDAIFAFSAAMEKGVTTDDLIAVMKLAIDDGWDMLGIQLTMAVLALEQVTPNRSEAA